MIAIRRSIVMQTSCVRCQGRGEVEGPDACPVCTEHAEIEWRTMPREASQEGSTTRPG